MGGDLSPSAAAKMARPLGDTNFVQHFLTQRDLLVSRSRRAP
jgi:hypothetical protein